MWLINVMEFLEALKTMGAERNIKELLYSKDNADMPLI